MGEAGFGTGFGTQIGLLQILDPSLLSYVILGTFWFFNFLTGNRDYNNSNCFTWFLCGLNELIYMSLLGGCDTANTIWVSAVVIWLTELMILLTHQAFPLEALEILRINIGSLKNKIRTSLWPKLQIFILLKGRANLDTKNKN